MTRLLVAVWLAAMLGAALLGCAASSIDPMEQQPKYKPYGGNPLFADGRAMRPLPVGTIPRERDLDLASSTGPGYPMALDRGVLSAGRHHYEIACAPCHGVVGDGRSMVSHKMLLREPPSLFSEKIRGYSPRQIYDVITDGYGLMNSYAWQLSPRERWSVTAYVQALQMSQTARISDVPPAERARIEALPEPPHPTEVPE